MATTAGKQDFESDSETKRRKKESFRRHFNDAQPLETKPEEHVRVSHEALREKARKSGMTKLPGKPPTGVE